MTGLPGKRRGLIMVNTGPGKGKTTAALGAALRASGRGLNVLVLQFIKNRHTGELEAVEKLPGVQIKQLGLGMIRGREVTIEDRKQAELAWGEVLTGASSGRYDLLILDEICPAMHHGLIEAGRVAGFLKEKPEKLHVILTGRYCPDDILDLADTVTIMEAGRHHLAAGIKSQEGIEY